MGTHPIFEADFDCLTDMSRSGTARIENRVKQKIKDGEFYEAHQMYRTIFSRQKQNKHLANALRIVHDGAVELFNAGESGSAGDLCILYCSGLDEMKNAEEYAKLAPTLHQQSQRMHMLTLQHLHVDQPERDQFEKRLITWSAAQLGNRCGSPVLREMIAENYWTLINERSASLPMEQRIMFYALARNHFIYARNGMRLAELLVELTMLYDEGREGVYVCMLTVFQLLCDNCPDEAKCFYQTFTKKHPKLSSSFPYEEPLLNLAHFLFEALETANQDTFLVLYQHYSAALNAPDQSYARYMRRVGTMYFGVQEKKQPKPQGGLMGMIQNMMSDMTGPMDSDEEGDDQSGGLNNLMSMASSMMGNMSKPQHQQKQPRKIVQDEDVDDLD